MIISLHKFRKKQLTKYIKCKKSTSKAEIKRRFNIHITNITRIINELLVDTIIKEDGVGSSTGGRKPILYTLNPDFGITISIIIDLNTLEISINDFLSNIIDREKVSLDFEKENIERKTVESIESILKRNSLKKSKLRGIGVGGSRGFLNKKEGSIRFKMIKKNIEIIPFLKRNYPSLPITFEDRVYMEALGEKNLGYGQKVKNFLYVHWGETISSVICINGEIYKHREGYISELGHIVINEEGPLCYCGNRGCLEQMASALYLKREVKEALEKGVVTHIKEINTENQQNILEAISEAAENRDRFAIGLLEQFSKNFGIGLSIMINLLHPELVIIGGNLPKKQDFCFKTLKHYIRMFSLREIEKNVRYQCSCNAEEMSLRGISESVVEEVLDNF